jgi:prefoldin subunit 5
VNLGEEFGVIRRIDNMINDLRGQKEKYEKRLNDLTVRIDVINNELAREEGFGDNIKALQAELDLLDEELGLKVAS